MLELLVGNKKVFVPSEFREVPVFTGIQVGNYVIKLELTHNDKIVVIATLSKMEPDIFFSMSKDTINQIYDSLNFLKASETQVSFYKTFYLDKKLYGFVDFENLTVHEYSDIEFYLADGEYPLENLDKILTVLFRPIVNKKQSLKNILINILLRIFHRNFIPQVYKSYEIKPYEEKDVKNFELFSKRMGMDFAIATYQNLLTYRQQINDDYPTIFKTGKSIPDEDKDQYDEPIPGYKEPKTFETIWGLYHCVAMLSSNLMERDTWYKRPIKEFFTYLLYFNQRTEIENERAKLAQQTTS